MLEKLGYNVEFIDVNKEVSTYVFKEEDFGEDAWIETDKIRVDIDVQRELIPKHVEGIVSKFDPSAFGRLHVTQREDGYYYCTDGQHRLFSAKALGLKRVPCVVVRCYSKRDEGLNFIHLNETSAQVSAVDKYRIGCTSELTDWLYVKECLDSIGITVGSNEKQVACVTSIYKFVNKPKSGSSVEKNIAIAKKSLKIIMECFGSVAITGTMFNAMCEFVRVYVQTGDITVQDIIDKLQTSTAPNMNNRAKEMRKTAGRGKLVNYLTYIIYVEYNKNLRRKLPLKISV